METQKSMIIIGAAGSGKSRRAQQEAEKRGNYVVTTWEELRRPFGLSILGSNPATVIVDEFSQAILKKSADRDYLKQLTSGDDLLINEKYKHPRTVPTPMFIFIVQTPPKLDLFLFGDICNRFDIVIL